MLARLWLCRTMSCSCSSHFSTSASTSEESSRSSRPNLAMLDCSWTHANTDTQMQGHCIKEKANTMALSLEKYISKKGYSFVSIQKWSTASHGDMAREESTAFTMQPIMAQTASILHVCVTRFPGDEFSIVRTRRKIWCDALCWGLYGLLYLCIQLDGFGSLQVSEWVFLWETERQQSEDYKPLDHWKIHEGGCCDTHPGSGKW